MAQVDSVQLPHREDVKDPCLAVTTISLGSVTRQESREDFPFPTVCPEEARLTTMSTEKPVPRKLTPHGQVSLKTTFTELPCRRPVSCNVTVCILQASHLGVARGELVMCAVKSDGNSQGGTSELKVSSAQSSLHWPSAEITFQAQPAVDLEIHVWGRRPASDNSLRWLAYGVFPFGYCTGKELQIDEQVKVLSIAEEHAREVWIPLEPQGFVQVQVRLSPLSNNQGTRAIKQTRSKSVDVSAMKKSPESNKLARRRQSAIAEKHVEIVEDAVDGEDEMKQSSKKPERTWADSDMMAVLKDRVELRREVDFLLGQLRDVKAQFAVSEWEKQQLVVENKTLRSKLQGKTSKLERIAQKATRLELKTIVHQSTYGDEEEGYGSAC